VELAGGPLPLCYEYGLPKAMPAILTATAEMPGPPERTELDPMAPPGRGLLHLVYDAEAECAGMERIPLWMCRSVTKHLVSEFPRSPTGTALPSKLSKPTPPLAARDSGDGAGAITVSGGTNYDHAMTFPRTADTPWGTDDADAATAPWVMTKAPYPLDAHPALLNHELTPSANLKVCARAPPIDGNDLIS